MSTSYKPEGYNSLSPYFIVNNAASFINWLKEIFDGKVTRKYESENGIIVHAEVKIDDSIIMLSEASENYPAQPMVLHLYVPNVIETFEKVKVSGCKIIEAPKTQENDPDTRATFIDLYGNMWSIGTQN